MIALDWLWILHPALAVLLVYPLIGIGLITAGVVLVNLAK